MNRSEPKAARWLLVFALTAALSVGVAACGGDDGDPPPAAQRTTGDTGATGSTGDTATPFTGATGTDTTTPTAGSASDPAVDSIRYFSPESPWNTSVDGLPVAGNSARLLQLGLERFAVREVPGRQGVETFVRKLTPSIFINTEAWAPLVVAAGGEGAEVTRLVCRQSDCGPDDPPVPDEIALPPGTTPDPKYDGWLSVIDLDAGLGYDFWLARRFNLGLWVRGDGSGGRYGVRGSGNLGLVLSWY